MGVNNTLFKTFFIIYSSLNNSCKNDIMLKFRKVVNIRN